MRHSSLLVFITDLQQTNCSKYTKQMRGMPKHLHDFIYDSVFLFWFLYFSVMAFCLFSYYCFIVMTITKSAQRGIVKNYLVCPQTVDKWMKIEHAGRVRNAMPRLSRCRCHPSQIWPYYNYCGYLMCMCVCVSIHLHFGRTIEILCYNCRERARAMPPKEALFP